MTIYQKHIKCFKNVSIHSKQSKKLVLNWILFPENWRQVASFSALNLCKKINKYINNYTFLDVLPQWVEQCLAHPNCFANVRGAQ